MLGPLVRAQLTALLTKKLVESPAFNAFVGNVHGTVTSLQQEAYDTLLKATQEHDAKFPHQQQDQTTNSSTTSDSSPSEPHRPQASESSSAQNEQLRKLIEKTKRDIESHNK